MDSNLIEIGETGHAIRRAFDRKAATLGVTRAQWRVLSRLSRYPGLRQVELADHLDVEPITLCRIVDRLEDAGLVERQRDPLDRRAWRVLLTDKAQPIVGKLRHLAAELAEQVFAGISPAEIEAMRSVLSRARGNVAAMEPPKKASNA
jgi:DNA-binding MarR family transcriptional regulator